MVNPISSCGPIWIAKLDPTGQTTLFATYIGVQSTGKYEAVNRVGLKTDAEGNIVVASVGFLEFAAGGKRDSIHAKRPIQSLSAEASTRRFSIDIRHLFGWQRMGHAGFVCARQRRCCLVAVYTNSPDFPSTPQSVITSVYGKTVVAKLSSDGQSLGYGVSFPYDFTLYPPQIDSSGSAYISFFSDALKLAPDGSSLQRSPFPAWTQASYQQFLSTGGGSFWLAGTTNNGFIPTTPDAVESFVRPVTYQRIEDSQLSSPQSMTPAHQIFDFAVDPFEGFRLYAATDGIVPVRGQRIDMESPELGVKPLDRYRSIRSEHALPRCVDERFPGRWAV